MELTFFITNILPIITTIGLFVIGWFLKGIDKRFEQVDKRFEQVDKRFEIHERRIEKMEDKMSNMDQRLGKIEGMLEALLIQKSHQSY